jgi:hypothetical protein
MFVNQKSEPRIVLYGKKKNMECTPDAPIGDIMDAFRVEHVSAEGHVTLP